MLFGEAASRFYEYMEGIDRSSHTIDKYKQDLRIIRMFLEERMNGQVYLEDVTVDDLEAFMLYSKDVKKNSPNTRSNYFYTLRAFYAFAYKKELVSRNISLSMDFMKMPKKERNYLTEEEVAEILKNIDNRLINLMVTFLFNTGLRITECRNLKVDDVDLNAKVIHVIEGKGRKDRTVPINDKLYKLLVDYKENWREGYKSDTFFASKRTGKASYCHINATLKEAAKKAGIQKQVSCHVLRHSFASALVKKNVNLVQIQKLLGHESLAVTSIYTHTNLEQLSEAVNVLNNL